MFYFHSLCARNVHAELLGVDHNFAVAAMFVGHSIGKL